MTLQIEIRPRWLGTTFEVSYFMDGSDRQYFNPEGRYTWGRDELPEAMAALMEKLTQPNETPEQPSQSLPPESEGPDMHSIDPEFAQNLSGTTVIEDGSVTISDAAGQIGAHYKDYNPELDPLRSNGSDQQD